MVKASEVMDLLKEIQKKQTEQDNKIKEFTTPKQLKQHCPECGKDTEFPEKAKHCPWCIDGEYEEDE